MIIRLAIALILPLLPATVIVERVVGYRRPAIVRVVLATMFALAASSCVLFLYLLVAGSPRGYFAFDVILWSLLTVGAIWWRRRWPKDLEAEPTPYPGGPVASVLGVAFVFEFLLALAQFIQRVASFPDGSWDAWAIWNLRARFLLYATNWKDAFDPAMTYSHLDYPLLLPGTIARIWTLSGASQLAPVVVAAVFTFGGILLVTGIVSSLKGPAQGYLAGLALCLGPVPFYGSWENADVPLGCYFVAAAAVLVLAEASSSTSRNRHLYLAGALAGAGAWTKNEGILFLLIVLIGYAVFGYLLQPGRWRGAISSSLRLVVGMAPFVVLIALFKHTAGASNDLTSSYGRSTWHLLTAWPRYSMIGRAFLHYGSDWYLWMIGVAGVLLAATKRIERHHLVPIQVGILPVVMLIGYFLVLVTSPKDLEWQLRTAADRLFVQLLPITVMIFFLVAPTLHDLGSTLVKSRDT